MSSGFSTSDSKNMNIGEKSLELELARLKQFCGRNILNLLRHKSSIFKKKNNWKLILPLSNVSRAEKSLLSERRLFPIEIIPEEIWAKKEGEKLDKMLEEFQADWTERYPPFNKKAIKEGDDSQEEEIETINYQKAKSLMLNFKLDYIGYLREKNSELNLLNIFMSEKDPKIKNFVL